MSKSTLGILPTVMFPLQVTTHNFSALALTWYLSTHYFYEKRYSNTSGPGLGVNNILIETGSQTRHHFFSPPALNIHFGAYLPSETVPRLVTTITSEH